MPSPINMQPVTYLRSEGQFFRFHRDTRRMFVLEDNGKREIMDGGVLSDILLSSSIVSKEEAKKGAARWARWYRVR